MKKTSYVFGEESVFLFFFAFAVFFEYFWIRPDELFVETIRKCGNFGFFTNLAVTVVSTIVFRYFNLTDNPLAAGTALGFGISIAAFAFMTFAMELKQRIGAGRDD